MRAYLLSATGAIILSAIVSCIASDGKMGKFVKGMSRLFVFSVLVAPLLSLFSEQKFQFSQSEIRDDERYFLYCAERLSETDEAEIRALLKEDYSIEAEIEVERGAEGGFPRKKIRIKISDFGLSEGEEHINTLTRISELIEKNYGCPAEVVWRERE